MRNLTRKLLAVFFLIGLNGVLLATSPGEAVHPMGQCTYWGDHCSCEEAVTEINCHFDSDCDWGVCDFGVQ